MTFHASKLFNPKIYINLNLQGEKNERGILRLEKQQKHNGAKKKKGTSPLTNNIQSHVNMKRSILWKIKKCRKAEKVSLWRVETASYRVQAEI